MSEPTLLRRLVAACYSHSATVRSQAAIISERGAAAETDPRLGPQLVQIAVAMLAGAAERAFTGVISARVQSNLGFRVPGKVIERFVGGGQDVPAGRLISGPDELRASMRWPYRRPGPTCGSAPIPIAISRLSGAMRAGASGTATMGAGGRTDTWD